MSSSPGDILLTAGTDDQARALVSDASRALAFGGLGDLVWGHVSVRDHEGRGIWMKAAGWGLEEITPESVQLISWQGEVLQGEGPRHIEYLIHTGVYRARPEVGSVVHAHSDTVNAWCAVGAPMQPLTHAGTLFSYPELPRFTETADLIRTEELGAALAAELAGAIGVLIPHHGFVMTGEDAAAAVMRAVLLERAARTLMLAEGAGEVSSWIGPERDSMGWPPVQLRAGWEYLVRRSRALYR